MPRARWFIIYIAFAIVVGMISGAAPIRPEVPRAIAGEPKATIVGTPTGDQLTIGVIMKMASDGTSSPDEYTMRETLSGVEIIEYNQKQVGNHHYNFFHLEAEISWCSNTAAPWIIIDNIHIMTNTEQGEWFCGTVPQGWDLLLDYPTQAYFSNVDADTLKAAIGHPDAFRVI